MSDSRGALCTVVMALAETMAALPATSRGVSLRMTVPLAMGLATSTVRVTLPPAPLARLPSDQVTLPEPASKLPPLEAKTKVVLGGTVSLRLAPLTVAEPSLAQSKR